MPYATGDRVRARRTDPPHHTRLPRYARGAVGVVVRHTGEHPLADHRARGLDAPGEPVYTVRVAARELFGEGAHAATLDRRERYLGPEPS